MTAVAPTSSHASLTGQERFSIILVVVGTFLEYFDVLLYYHMAVVIAPLFFPQGDPFIAGLLGVFAFASTYLFRPIGAFFFGYLGDTLGRKRTIILTTLMMGAATLTIGCSHTYEEVGVIAPILLLLARMVQGFSSVGELIGSYVFTAEVAKKSRYIYFLGTVPQIASALGGLAALFIGAYSLSVDPVNGWRWPFLFGALVAIFGAFARLKLIEFPVFLQVQQKARTPTLKDAGRFFRSLVFRQRNYYCYLGIGILGPFKCYLIFFYCTGILKNVVGLSPEEVLDHNKYVALFMVLTNLMWGASARWAEPFAILKTKTWIGILSLPLVYGLIFDSPTQLSVFLGEILFFFLLGETPILAKVVHAFPVIGRYTHLGSAFALSHAATYVVTAHLVFFLDSFVGNVGGGLLTLVVLSIFVVAIYSFIPEEKMMRLPTILMRKNYTRACENRLRKVAGLVKLGNRFFEPRRG